MLDAALNFSTLVSLLGQFVSERRAEKSQTVDEYLEWLRRHNHSEIVNQIAGNAELLREIDESLSGKLSEIDEALKQLRGLVLSVSNNSDVLHPLAVAAGIDASISDQAVALLKCMEDSGAALLMVTASLQRKHFILREGGSGEFTPTEPRFIEDDIASLTELGMLRIDHIGEHNVNYRITRLASRFVKQLK